MGVQYRTGIYYTDPADLPVIQEAIGELQKTLDRPVVVEVKPLEKLQPRRRNTIKKVPGQEPGGLLPHWPGQVRGAARALVDPEDYAPPEQARSCGKP